MQKELAFYPSVGDLPFSKAVRAGGFLFLSGQIPFDEQGKPHKGTITEQTTSIMSSISKTLDELGSSLARIVKVTVWLSDLSNFNEFNTAYRSFFVNNQYPVRSLVQAELAFGVGVEIEVQALDMQN